MSTLRETPAPRLHEWPPQACATADPEWFFPPKEGSTAGYEARAKQVCSRCEAIQQCGEYAMPITDLFGVWGGMSQGERTRARKKKQKEAN